MRQNYIAEFDKFLPKEHKEDYYNWIFNFKVDSELYNVAYNGLSDIYVMAERNYSSEEILRAVQKIQAVLHHLGAKKKQPNLTISSVRKTLDKRDKAKMKDWAIIAYTKLKLFGNSEHRAKNASMKKIRNQAIDEVIAGDLMGCKKSLRRKNVKRAKRD